MMWFGASHLLSVPLALMAVLLLGWPHWRKLARKIAWVSLVMSLPVLVVLPFLPSMLGGRAARAIALMLVSPSLATLVLLPLKRWNE